MASVTHMAKLCFCVSVCIERLLNSKPNMKLPCILPRKTGISDNQQGKKITLKIRIEYMGIHA